MRADKKKNLEKIANEIVGNGTQTVQEIAKRTGLAKGTVSVGKRELEQNGTIAKDDDIIKIADDAKQIAELAQNEMLRRLVEKPKDIKDRDLNSFAKEGVIRHGLLKGDVTDNKGGLKDLSKYGTDELLEMLDK